MSEDHTQWSSIVVSTRVVHNEMVVDFAPTSGDRQMLVPLTRREARRLAAIILAKADEADAYHKQREFEEDDGA